MSNEWKVEKVNYRFGITSFRYDNASVVKKTVFPGGSSLLAQTYSSSTDVQKFITLRPFMIQGRLKRVLYNYCIGLPVRFLTCQHQN
jgi:hypothetical protein